tara:strand:+ start:2752 stop:3141 length:390 start_codon:yes stop_codon:yes gene_type:complete
LNVSKESFNKKTYNQYYVPEEVSLTTATAKMFNCDFVIRKDKTQFHFYPKIKPLNATEHTALFTQYRKLISEGLNEIIGENTHKRSIIIVDDGIVDSNIYVGVEGFGSDNDLSRPLVEKLITYVHEKTA